MILQKLMPLQENMEPCLTMWGVVELVENTCPSKVINDVSQDVLGIAKLMLPQIRTSAEILGKDTFVDPSEYGHEYEEKLESAGWNWEAISYFIDTILCYAESWATPGTLRD